MITLLLFWFFFADPVFFFISGHIRGEIFLSPFPKLADKIKDVLAKQQREQDRKRNILVHFRGGNSSETERLESDKRSKGHQRNGKEEGRKRELGSHPNLRGQKL